MVSNGTSKLRVLWATDGSQGAHNAIPLLRNLIAPVSDSLTVLAVAHRGLTDMRPGGRSHALAESEKLAQAEGAMLSWPQGVEAASRFGNPIEEILRQARTSRSHLIVMGAKGHTNLGMLVLGSVSHGVVSHASIPVLLAKASKEGPQSILLAYDGSPAARKAIRFLEQLHLARGTQLKLVHAIEPFTMPSGMPVGYRELALKEAHQINEALHKRSTRALQAIVKRLEAPGITITAEVVNGAASPALLDAAKQQQANLIVVGSRRPSAVRHYLLGSTAEKIVRHANASVLVVR